MMRHARIFSSFLVLTAFAAFSQNTLPSQELPSDLPADSVPSYMKPVSNLPLSADSIAPQSPESLSARMRQFEATMSEPLFPHISMEPITSVGTMVPGVATFRLWDGGYAVASGSSASYPGLMGIESGSLSFIQQLGNFTFTAYGAADKYGYFRGLQTSYSFGGSLSYRINPKWAITVFGSYSTPLHPVGMAMAGYMDAPNFGGYATYDINEHWGIHVGAQATRSLVTNRWEAQPIVMPYYKINGKAAIGLDVGGILYNAVKNYQDRKSGYRSNPTIGPPVGGPPPVAPRPDKH